MLPLPGFDPNMHFPEEYY